MPKNLAKQPMSEDENEATVDMIRDMNERAMQRESQSVNLNPQSTSKPIARGSNFTPKKSHFGEIGVCTGCAKYSVLRSTLGKPSGLRKPCKSCVNGSQKSSGHGRRPKK